MKDISQENFTDPKPLVDRLKTSRKIVTSTIRHGWASKGTAALTFCRNKICVKPLKCSKKIICTFLYYFMIFYQLNLKQLMGCQHLLLWSTYQSMVTVYSSHYRQTFKEFCPSLNPPHGLLQINLSVMWIPLQIVWTFQ